MNKKLRYNRLRFMDRAEVGGVYDICDIAVSGEIWYRDLLCVPNDDYSCDGCCLRDAGLICAFKPDGYVCGTGKFIPLSDLLEDL